MDRLRRHTKTVCQIHIDDLQWAGSKVLFLLFGHVHRVNDSSRDLSGRMSRIEQALPESAELSGDIQIIDRRGENDPVCVEGIVQQFRDAVLDPTAQILAVRRQLAGKAAFAAGVQIIVEMDDLDLRIRSRRSDALQKRIQ